MFQSFRSEMINFLSEIKKKINKEINPEYIDLIDNSNLENFWGLKEEII